MYTTTLKLAEALALFCYRDTSVENIHGEARALTKLDYEQILKEFTENYNQALEEMRSINAENYILLDKIGRVESIFAQPSIIM